MFLIHFRDHLRGNVGRQNIDDPFLGFLRKLFKQKRNFRGVIFLQDKRQRGVIVLKRGFDAQQVGFINFEGLHGRLKYALMTKKSELNRSLLLTILQPELSGYFNTKSFYGAGCGVVEIV